ncbi:nucleotide-binding alpha-beta plait domain-containing protein [Tanacetum coccineum]
MGDCDWTEVSRKKKGFIIGSQRSKEDEVQKLTMSVFVTNFPDLFKAKDLWNTCKQYGNVVDAYIPNRRSKAGRFLALVLQLQIGYGYRQARMPLVESIMDAPWFIC